MLGGSAAKHVPFLGVAAGCPDEPLAIAYAFRGHQEAFGIHPGEWP